MLWNKPRNVWWWLALLTPAVLAIAAAQVAKWWMPPLLSPPPTGRHYNFAWNFDIVLGTIFVCSLGAAIFFTRCGATHANGFVAVAAPVGLTILLSMLNICVAFAVAVATMLPAVPYPAPFPEAMSISIVSSETLLKRTQSRCPVCHVDCPAEVWKVGDAKQQRVMLRRRCAEHGEAEACIASDARFYWVAQGEPENACCGGNACAASDGAVRGARWEKCGAAGAPHLTKPRQTGKSQHLPGAH